MLLGTLCTSSQASNEFLFADAGTGTYTFYIFNLISGAFPAFATVQQGPALPCVSYAKFNPV